MWLPPGRSYPQLINSLFDKKNYIIHYGNLKQALEHGLNLIRIHRVSRFNQPATLKSYIELNSNLRKNARNESEKDSLKILNNSVYGKFLENLKTRMNFKLNH